MADGAKSFRAELEKKRIQLAQLKEEKERRSRLRQAEENLSPNKFLSSFESKDKLNEDADAVLKAFGLTNLSRASTAPSGVSSMHDSSTVSTATTTGHLTQNNSRFDQSKNNNQSSASLNASLSEINDQSASIKKPSVPLQVVHVNQISIPPKERVIYSKTTQTIDAPPPDTNAPINTHSYYMLTDPYLEDDVSSYDFKQDDSPTDKESEHAEIRTVTEEEQAQIELREDYQKFVDRATKVLERALHKNESSDIFIQYFPDGSNGEIDDETRSAGKLSLNRVFCDDRWSVNRCVTSFDWSTQYPELLLASYHNNESAPSDPDGIALVWNTKFKNTTPEYVFNCQSPIMSCCFAKFHPSLIVGGTYSGRIVLWDMRSNKKTPVQRSPSTTAAHTHPIYCAKVVGSQNAHNLISVSTDGKLCSWSLDMLSAPQETMELSQQKQTRSVAVTCMSFHPDDYNNFLIGSEDGSVYSACRHGSKSGILSSFEGHQGLVTGVDFRTSDSQSSHSHLFLTSSIDWTIKLWDTKDAEPIHSFESNCDYIYDVKWSPAHPGLFASADGVGRVDIWNLFNDSELPSASTTIEGQPSLNKLIWTPHGNQVVVGSDEGKVYVYDVGDIGTTQPNQRQEEKWSLGEQITRAVKM